jgi:hypothetical protein
MEAPPFNVFAPVNIPDDDDQASGSHHEQTSDQLDGELQHGQTPDQPDSPAPLGSPLPIPTQHTEVGAVDPVEQVRVLMAKWDMLCQGPADEDGWGIVEEARGMIEAEHPQEPPLNIDEDENDQNLDAHMEAPWEMVQERLEELLVEFGLIDEKLAQQDGEAEDLVHQLLEHQQLEVSAEQRAYHIQRMRKLIDEALKHQPGCKRRRGQERKATAQMIEDYIVMARLAATRGTGSGEKSREGPPMEHILPRKGRRRFMQSSLAMPKLSKEEFDRRRREEWCEVAIQILRAGNTPTAILASASTSSKATFMGALGSTRAGTLEAYCTAFNTFADHLEILGGPRWPRSVIEVVDYLHDRASEPCSPSTPQVFLQALNWMERVANIPKEDRFGGQDLVRRTVDYVTELVAAGGPPQKQAPRLPLVIMASLELYVCNEARPKARRLKAFSILLKCNATLREDDIQHLHPKRLRYMGQIVVSELTRTKTSGKTKRVKELPIVLWTGATLTGTDWIKIGLELATSFGDPSRDHLLPVASKDGNYAVGGPLCYSSSAALEKCLFEELKIPVYEDNRWKDGTKRLIDDGLQGYWTQHSPRAVIPSFLACLEVEKTRADYVGRWSPSGSESYTRTFRSVVKALQMLVYTAIRKGDPRIDEEDVLDTFDRVPRGRITARNTARCWSRE